MTCRAEMHPVPCGESLVGSPFAVIAGVPSMTVAVLR